MALRYAALVIVLSLLLTACSSRHNPAPVSALESGETRKINIQGEHYRVKRGDTLYAIAFSANKDVKEIAKLNGIKPPYTIYPNQLIYLESQWLKKLAREKARRESTSKQKINKNSNKNVAKAKKPEYVQKTASTKAKQKNVSKSSGSIRWKWPAQGSITQKFSNRENGFKGIEIANKMGTSVHSAADGVVVYAGNALRGYGNLIIVKHNDDYLSAYAHNSRLLVKEKQDVKAGQKIAEMGNSEARRTALRFEIRYRGKAVNPSKFLP